MIWTYLKRGIAAGALAGVVYGIFMALVGNPLTAYMEELAHHGHDHGHGHDHAHAVSETTTAIVSVGSGVLWGIFLGGVFALAYYFLEPAIPGTDSVKPYVLAGAGFLTVSVTPWLVLPPTAPGMEQSLATTPRLGIYAGLMIAGALLAALSFGLYHRVADRDRRLAVAAAVAPIAAAVLLVPVATPTIITAGGVSGELVTAYQGMVAFSQGGLWLLIAGGYRWFSGRDGAQPTEDVETSGISA